MGHTGRWEVWQPVGYSLGLKELGCLSPRDEKAKGSRITVFKHGKDCHIEDDRI